MTRLAALFIPWVLEHVETPEAGLLTQEALDRVEQELGLALVDLGLAEREDWPGYVAYRLKLWPKVGQPVRALIY